MTNNEVTPKDKVIGRNMYMARTNLKNMSLLRLSIRCQSRGIKIGQRELLKIEAGERHVSEWEVYMFAEALMVSVAYLITDRPAEWARAREHTNAPQTSVQRDTGA